MGPVSACARMHACVPAACLCMLGVVVKSMNSKEGTAAPRSMMGTCRMHTFNGWHQQQLAARRPWQAAVSVLGAQGAR